MSNILRLTASIRLHQVWDAIESFTDPQKRDREALVSVMKRRFKLPEDELYSAVGNALTDYLIEGQTKNDEKGNLVTVLKLPNVKLFLEDLEKYREEHDWYCFKCHLGGNMDALKCTNPGCYRSFHVDCLPRDPLKKSKKSAPFVCPPCVRIATAAKAKKVDVNKYTLNSIIGHICSRFKSWHIPLFEKMDGETWALVANRKKTEAWRLQLLVHKRMQMDLNAIIVKAGKNEYKSLEEFLVDCETVCHAMASYFGLEILESGQIGDMFIQEVRYDTSDVQRCPECFHRSCELSPWWWFAIPCKKPHRIVWAKMSGYPYWPAKIIHSEGSSHEVRYFGGRHERGYVNDLFIKDIDTSLNELKIGQAQRSAKWTEAYEELQTYQSFLLNPNYKPDEKVPPRVAIKQMAPSPRGS